MKNTNDLTIGNPIKGILIFVIPILASNFFQHMYNMVDMIIVGHILGENALAAVGATSALYGFFTSMAYGMTNGFSIVIARYFGSKDEKGVKNAVGLTMLLSMMIAAVLTIVGVLGARPLLVMLKTPDEIIGQSYSYIIVVLAGIVITMLYNMYAGIMRGVGNSLMPLVFLIISAFCNIMLDIIFIGSLHMGVAGAAWATVLAQMISVIFCVWYINKKFPAIKVQRENLKWHGNMVSDLFMNGLSMALMYSIVSVGTIALQSAINSLGALTVAAHTAGRKVAEMCMMFFTPLSVAGSTYCSQNLGAGKKERISQGIKATFVLGFGAAVLVNMVTFTLGRPILVGITGSDNQELIGTALQYLYVMLPFYFALTILLTLRSALQGLGHKLIPLSASVIELVSKFMVAGVLVPRIGYMGVCIAEPLVWVICSVLVLIDYLGLMKKMMK